MSIAADKKKRIMFYMLEHIYKNDKNFITKTVEAFSISKTTAYKYLKQMIADGHVRKNEEKACKYSLVSNMTPFKYDTAEHLEEDRIYQNDIYPLVKDLPENVTDIIMGKVLDYMECG